MKRARTSLPVPLSPAMSTVQSLAATRRASAARRRDGSAHATKSTESCEARLEAGVTDASLGDGGSSRLISSICAFAFIATEKEQVLFHHSSNPHLPFDPVELITGGRGLPCELFPGRQS